MHFRQLSRASSFEAFAQLDSVLHPTFTQGLEHLVVIADDLPQLRVRVIPSQIDCWVAFQVFQASCRFEPWIPLIHFRPLKKLDERKVWRNHLL